MPWVADLRDSVAANSDRRVEKLTVWMKERGQALVARLVAARASAVVAVSDAIAEGMHELGAARVETIPNGCDFEDFEALEYRRGDRVRITHTGTFFGHRDPRPFLTALAAVEDDVIARFVGGLRSSDREFADPLGLGDRVVAPDDVRALQDAIAGLRAQWRAGALDGTRLTDELRQRLSRRTRSREFAELLRSVA